MTPLPPPQMLKLPIFQPAEIDSPAQMFRCEFYRATIAAGICMARQKHRFTPRLGGNKVGEPRVTIQFKYCASGECGQGNVIAKGLEGYEPESEDDAKDEVRRERTETGRKLVAEIEKKLEERPAPPAEEKRVAEAIEEESKTCECGKDIRRGRDGVVPEKCFKCRLKAGEVSGRKGKPPRKPKAQKPRTVADVAKKYTKVATSLPPANDDVVALLERKRKHHLDQAERIGKAIEALLEVA